MCDKNWLVNVNKEERKVLGVKWVDTEVRSGFTGKNQLGVSSTTGIALANLTFRFLFPIVAIGLLALRMWRECTEEPIGGIGVVAVTTNAVLCVVAIMLFVFGGVLRNWEY